MKNKRTNYAGELRKSHESQTVTVCGFVQRQRDLGQLIFIDLRDRTGIVQLAFNDQTDKEIFKLAFETRSEFVVSATGKVAARSSVNKEIPTGEIEIIVEDFEIISRAKTPPFEITENSKVNEELRMTYRYLDLRRPDLQRNIIMRHKITKIARDFYDENGFLEIETPMMIKSTPEGARDYLVPSRLYNGEFYALPQSPQIYKQLLMVAGFDRYMQIARCFRDEDLRADRQPEFTQIDLEMSFVDMDELLSTNERFIARLFKEILNIEVPLPLPRMTFARAMNDYGSDKPDTRFDMKIVDLSDLLINCGFSVFSSAIENGGSVRAICAKNAASTYTRKAIDRLIDFAKGIGSKGLAWIRLTEEGVVSSFSKFMSEEEMNAIIERTNAQIGDVIVIAADKTSSALSIMGAVRNEMAKTLDIIPKDKYNILWITEMPFFDYNEDEQKFEAMHHPFTSPVDEDIEYLTTDPARVRAKAFDLVVNGVELSSGSIRITNPQLQRKMFTALGLTDEEVQVKFGHLVDAYNYASPPHGGMGIGLDRLCMILLGCDSLKDVLAFPKMQNARELMSNCPSPCDQSQLDELGLIVK